MAKGGRRMLPKFGMLFLLIVSHAPAPAAGLAVPAVSGPVPVSATSHIYMASADARIPIDLPAHGFLEEEFVFAGKANVYDWAKDGSVRVHSPDAPYTSRMIVRRPADPAKFSGTVWVELLNPVAFTDMSSGAWGYANYYIMDRGDAWIGITAAGDSLKTLKRFDAARYAALAMANPAPLSSGCAAAGRSYSAETEDGLRWDMLSEVGALLRSKAPGRPLAALKVRRMFVFGQSNGDLATYIAAFANRAKLAGGKPVWDGYLIKDSGIASPASQCDPRPTATDPRRVFRNISAPVVQVVVEDGVFNNYGSRRADSDAPGDRYRRFEIPGANHGDPHVHDWLPKAAIFTKVGINPLWPFAGACFPRREPSDFPIHYYVAGAMGLLDEWVATGAVPPRADRITISNEGMPDQAIARDALGNGLGGVRNAFVEVPTAAYNQPGPCSARGDVKVPFDWPKLTALYGSYDAFAARLAAAVDRDVEAGWVPAAYAARMKAGLTSEPTVDQAPRPPAPPARPAQED